jgi:hypothetical protein
MLQAIYALCFLMIAISSQLLAELPSEETTLKAGGNDAKTIIQKARVLLSAQQVFAARGVGYGGEPTSGCWALTVLTRHDKEASEIFDVIFRSSDEPAAKLYAVAGLLILDPKKKNDFTPKKLGKLAELEVQRLDRCIGDVTTFGAIVAELIEHGSSRYTYDTLPSLYSTTDCAKILKHEK